jgi:hypothetical protein
LKNFVNQKSNKLLRTFGIIKTTQPHKEQTVFGFYMRRVVLAPAFLPADLTLNTKAVFGKSK